LGDHEYDDDRHAAADVPRGRIDDEKWFVDVMDKFKMTRGGIQFPTREEASHLVEKFNETFPRVKEMGQRMRTTEEILAEAEEHRLQAERLEQIAEQRAKYGEDPFKNGTVLKIEMKYRTGRMSYTYGVIKIGGKFYFSGKMGNAAEEGQRATGKTWEQFVAWLSQGDATVWRARSLEQVL
jgi:hypothetical protein